MAGRQQRYVMAALRDLNRSSGRLLRKAASIARAHDAGLHFVHVIALPYGPSMTSRASIRAAADDVVRQRAKELSKLLREAAVLRGIPTKTTVTWDYPASEGIVRQVLKYKPLLLVAESHRHGAVARVFLSNTDWDLIRNCPCPLWLSKTDRYPARPTVLAAVDPFHAHAKPAGLDDVIMRHALDAAGGQARRVQVLHSYRLPQPVAVDGVVEAYWLAMSEAEQKQYEKKIHRAIDRVCRRHEVPTDNVKVIPGDPVAELPRIAKRSGADVVVMGAVSRSGIKRFFIGNTAERAIDAIDCDVLVVKPRRYRTPVTRRPHPLMPLPPL